MIDRAVVLRAKTPNLRSKGVVIKRQPPCYVVAWYVSKRKSTAAGSNGESLGSYDANAAGAVKSGGQLARMALHEDTSARVR